MHYLRRMALAASTLALVCAVPAAAQDDPFVGGDYVEVTGVTVDDGHYLDYANFLAGFYKAQEQYAVSQGWETGWEVLANVHKRKGEPDLYLIRRYKNERFPTIAITVDLLTTGIDVPPICHLVFMRRVR